MGFRGGINHRQRIPVAMFKAHSARAGYRFCTGLTHGSADHLIPAIAIFGQITCCGDDQPFFGARHRHVKQPQPFRHFARFAVVQRTAHRGRHVPFGQFPHRRVADLDDLVADHQRALSGIRQDHDRCLKPLGPVHGHHPHLIRRIVDLALDLKVVCLHPHQKPREAGDRTAFIR